MAAQSGNEDLINPLSKAIFAFEAAGKRVDSATDKSCSFLERIEHLRRAERLALDAIKSIEWGRLQLCKEYIKTRKRIG